MPTITIALTASTDASGAGQNWTFDWWGSKTETPGRTGDEFAYSARAGYQTGDWNNGIRFVQVGDAVQPGSRFPQSIGRLSLLRHLVHAPRARAIVEVAQAVESALELPRLLRLDGYYQSGQWHVDLTEVEFANGGRFGPSSTSITKGCSSRSRSRRRTSAVGSYDYPSPGLDLSDESELAGVAHRCAATSGRSTTARATVERDTRYARGASFTSSLLVDYNDVHLDRG
jgi:hypothetical protein